jgi:hypothetical protein
MEILLHLLSGFSYGRKKDGPCLASGVNSICVCRFRVGSWFHNSQNNLAPGALADRHGCAGGAAFHQGGGSMKIRFVPLAVLLLLGLTTLAQAQEPDRGQL